MRNFIEKIKQHIENNKEFYTKLFILVILPVWVAVWLTLFIVGGFTLNNAITFAGLGIFGIPILLALIGAWINGIILWITDENRVQKRVERYENKLKKLKEREGIE